MSRRHRLRGRRRISRIQRDGKPVRTVGVRARAVPGRTPSSRAAIAVVKTRSSVERNRARRRVRAALGTILAASPALDVVLWIERDFVGLPFVEVQRRLSRIVVAASAAVQP